MPRPETGVMQFVEDWPGVFIRGDNAMAYSEVLAALIVQYKTGEVMPALWARVANLERLLASCDARRKTEAQMAKLVSSG
jgi:hypothetical protein